MAAESSERFQKTLLEIRQRWGSDALRPLSTLRADSTHIPTGFAALDKLLGGGVACGQAVELRGAPTSGVTTLALMIIAGAQAQGRPVIYLDLARVFDPVYAARCGARLDGLLIARPEKALDGLDIMAMAAAEAGAALIVFDSMAEIGADPRGVGLLRSSLRKLAPALRRSGSAALLLNPQAEPDTATFPAGLRLLVENIGWIEQGRDITGLRARVSLLRNQRGGQHQQVEVTMTLDDFVRENVA